MLYEKASAKSFDEIDLGLREAGARHKFGILATHDLQQTMRNKGVEFPRRVVVYEVCNPFKASEALSVNGAVSTALPCRISVYETQEGHTRLATILPTALMSLFSEPALEGVGESVEATLKAMIDEAA
jgi:uncharacterized protein (DUF302 family)